MPLSTCRSGTRVSDSSVNTAGSTLSRLTVTRPSPARARDARNFPTAWARSFAPNTAEPATKVSAPARAIASMLPAFTPPSTSSQMSRPLAVMRLRTSRSFVSAEAMNDCPPKPGFTLMMRIRSTLSIA